MEGFNVPLGISHLQFCLVVIIKAGTMHFNQLTIKSRDDSTSLELYLLITPADILTSEATVGINVRLLFKCFRVFGEKDGAEGE